MIKYLIFLVLSLVFTLANPLAVLQTLVTPNRSNWVADFGSKALALTTKLPYVFQRPPNNGSPGTQGDLGGRGDCPVENQRLQAIVPIPKEESENKTVGGVTASERPDFWFATNLVAECGKLQFVLKSDRDVPIYRTSVEFPKDTKAFAVKLPPKVSLQVGTSYQWALMVNRENSPPIEVTGWVQRVQMAEPTGTPIQKAIQYADQGIWYEAVSLVQGLLVADPTDPAAIAFWNAIVSDAGLKDRGEPNPF